MSVVITVDSPNVYAVKFPFNRGAVDAIKQQVKSSLRAWDGENKCWLVQQPAISLVANLLTEHFGEAIAIPPMNATEAQPQIVKRLVRLEYLGQCKDRGNDEPEGFGFANGQWSVVIPQSVLTAFFGEQSVEAKQTLYQILCVTEKAPAQEIKSAHRRLARQWHPDVCQEDGAREKFEQLQYAYEMLSEPTHRKRYDAGLYFERQGKSDAKKRINSGLFVSPLRCGQLKVEGYLRMARLVVTAIHDWQDIVREDGAILVTTWPKNAQMFQSIWVPVGVQAEPF